LVQEAAGDELPQELGFRLERAGHGCFEVSGGLDLKPGVV
jgi:hypothetical protein